MAEQTRRLNRQQAFELYDWMKANADRFDGKPYTMVAEMATVELPFPVSPGSVREISRDCGITWNRPTATKKRNQEQVIEDLESRVAELSGRVEELESQVEGLTRQGETLGDEIFRLSQASQKFEALWGMDKSNGAQRQVRPNGPDMSSEGGVI